VLKLSKQAIFDELAFDERSLTISLVDIWMIFLNKVYFHFGDIHFLSIFVMKWILMKIN